MRPARKSTIDLKVIRQTYEELGEPNCFEAFDYGSVNPDDIEAALGTEVLTRYMHWIYINIK